MQSQPQVVAQPRIQSAMQQVYLWMTAGLLVTGAVSSMVMGNESILASISNPIVFFGLIIAEVILVIALSATIMKLSPAMATGLFLFYAMLNGITLTPLVLVYTASSVAAAFFTTAGSFAALALYGSTTKRDLSGMGKFLLMGVIGLIIASIVNMFIGSGPFSFIISIVGVLVFAGLTVYNTQRLTQMAQQMVTEEDTGRFAIYGALTLYLDFINLFIYMLRLFGVRRD
ncbi:MAG: Bax inhibitor-1/YccA family protein [Roseiflexaceae bacterium]|jgi:FtsH-binding integral membrane protein|nr:Bax inhibitor-1/YccA family protein [Chloroflexaceae bacterium]